MKAKLFSFIMLALTVYCVDKPLDIDRCFATKEKAAAYCDTFDLCRGLYEKTHK